MMQLTFKRYEIKYQLTEDQCARLMQAMEPYMTPDEWGPSTVCNVYYDTPTNLLIRRSLDKPIYKEKVRIRTYGKLKPGKPVFLELKKKSEGVVYKRRATMDSVRAAQFLHGEGDPQNQIERELDFSIKRYGSLVPAAYIAYDREAFYANDDHEFRMTFDRRVRYRTQDMDLSMGDEGTQILPDGKVLLEVKCVGAMPLWLVRFLSKERIYKTSFSKYGTAYQQMVTQGLGRRETARHLRVEPAPTPWTQPTLLRRTHERLSTAVA